MCKDTSVIWVVLCFSFLENSCLMIFNQHDYRKKYDGYAS